MSDNVVYLGGGPEASAATCRTAGSKERGLFTPGNRWTTTGTVANKWCQLVSARMASKNWE